MPVMCPYADHSGLHRDDARLPRHPCPSMRNKCTAKGSFANLTQIPKQDAQGKTVRSQTSPQLRCGRFTIPAGAQTEPPATVTLRTQGRRKGCTCNLPALVLSQCRGKPELWIARVASVAKPEVLSEVARITTNRVSYKKRGGGAEGGLMTTLHPDQADLANKRVVGHSASKDKDCATPAHCFNSRCPD